MSKIKICGIKRFEDILAVNEAKPDYVGFVFAKSKRRVSPEQASELIAMLAPQIKTVGVFVDEEIRAAAEIARKCPLDIIQLHGSESAVYIRKIRGMTHKEIWKAVRVQNENSITEAQSLGADRLLLDSFVEETAGGSGVAFDHEILKNFSVSEMIIAGGISKLNITETIKTLKPFAVDISSGAETGGIKDADKIAELVAAAREAEREE